VTKQILNTESPNLVVLNGDLITGESTYLSNSTAYFDQIVAPLVDKNLRWASSYGNHDRDFNLSIAALYEREKKFELSLTARMVSGDEDEVGVTNYFLPIYPSSSDSDTPSVILYFLDSRGGKKFQYDGNSIDIPGVVSAEAISWLRNTSSALALHHNRIIPSLLFTHIPPSVMLSYQSSGTGPDPLHQPGLNDDVPLDAQKSDAELLALIAEMSETRGLRATFSGHDHGNDWCFRWTGNVPVVSGTLSASHKQVIEGKGSFHCFGRHSGYGGYGNWARGSRQILLDEELLGREVETWIRLEDGSVSGRVRLNRTFGVDEYPVVEY
jgi:Calcineurin-like phosphoesterase